jgi:hypothetical protein
VSDTKQVTPAEIRMGDVVGVSPCLVTAIWESPSRPGEWIMLLSLPGGAAGSVTLRGDETVQRWSE